MSKMMKCWSKDSSGNYVLVEREAPDWDNPYVPPEPDWVERSLEAEEVEQDKCETELYGRPLDKDDVEVPKIDEHWLLKQGN